METTTHPEQVKIGDTLTIIYQNDEIDVTVVTEPFEVEELDENNKGWWQCGIRWRKGENDWYAVWTKDNPVWEIGER